MEAHVVPLQSTVKEPMRNDLVTNALDTGELDDSIVVFDGPGTNDLLVDEGALRGVEPTISAWAAKRDMVTIAYSEAGGVRAVNAPDGPRARVPSGIDIGTPVSIALDVMFDSAGRGNDRQCMVLQFSEGVLPNDHGTGFAGDTARIVEQIATRAVDPVWRAAGHRIVLVGRTGRIDERLTRLPGFNVVTLGLPKYDERKAGLELMSSSTRHPLVLEPDLELAAAARTLGGITLDETSRMRYRSSATSPLGLKDIIEEKKYSIRQMAGDSLTVRDDVPNFDTDVAGLPQVRRFIREEVERGNFNLRAVLTGPPGNGKSWVASAIAAELGNPAIYLGRIEGHYVGESQDNLRRAFDGIEANLPATLILEEIDQSVLGRRGGYAGDGSNVKADLRAMMFEWLGDVGDQRGISVIGLSNRPDLLDEASSDRFTMLPILHPDPVEAAQIMAIQARRSGLDLDLESTTLALMACGDVFSGRQLVRLLGSAEVHARRGGRTSIGGDDVTWAVGDAMERIGPAEERQSLLAVAATSFARHLPWNAARDAGFTDAQPPNYLQPFVFNDGTVDMVALRGRIRELEHQGVR